MWPAFAVVVVAMKMQQEYLIQNTFIALFCHLRSVS